MTNEALLDEVLTDYYDDYLSKFDDVAEHRFSLRHRLKMKKIFRLYEKNVQKLLHEPAVKQHEIGKVRFNRKTVLVIVAIVLLSVIAGCAVAYFVSESFIGTVHDDNTQLFAINIEGAPTTIEYTYTLSELPQGMELLEANCYDCEAYINYYNDETGDYIVFYQYTKAEYSPHYNTEQKDLFKIDIVGHEGIIMEMNDNNGEFYIISWDNGEYIFETISNLHKSILMDLLKTLKRNNL